MRTDGRQLQIGEFVLDLDAATLSGTHGSTSLDPKDLSVLLHLIEATPQVVSTDDLLDRSWSGIVVGDNALQQVIARLRKAFEDNARNPRYIETQPKRGYRLLVAATALEQAGEAKRRTVSLKLIAGGIALALIALFGALWPFGTESQTWPDTYHITLASHSPADQFHAHAAVGNRLVNEVRNALGKRVLCPADFCRPVAIYTEHPADASAQPTYVLDVFIEEAEPLRVDATLSRGSQATTIWSGAFESEAGTTELAARLANAVIAMTSADIRWQNQDIDPWLAGGTQAAKRTWLEGVRQLSLLEMGDRSSAIFVYDHFKKSVELDPNFFAGHVSMAVGYTQNVFGGNWRDNAANAEAAIDQARRIRPGDEITTHSLQQIMHRALTWNYPASLASGERLLELMPPRTRWSKRWEIARVHFQQGRIALALQEMQTAYAAPKDELTVPFLISYAQMLNWTGEHERALSRAGEARSLVAFGPIAVDVHVQEALALRGLHQPERARAAFDRAWTAGGVERGARLSPWLVLFGQSEKAVEALEANPNAHPAQSATAHLLLGQVDQAVSLMRSAILAHDEMAPVQLRYNPQWRSAGDARLRGLLEALEQEEVRESRATDFSS